MFSDFIGDFGPEGGYLLVRKPVLAQIGLQSREIHSGNETGGILIGSYRGHHIDITSSTVQQSKDVASRFRFHRKDKNHHGIAMKAWEQSGGFQTYLGEWHSHPEAHPTPSGIDASSWIRATEAIGKKMVFIIVGRQSTWIGYTYFDRKKCMIGRSKPAKPFVAADTLVQN
ncbi:Mov34/MPN/PAD-1 family protein [Kordiimonas lipolytica]|uniref:Mov34/MPN/PAD-1 family protein n=1 Tax=Kordiimonas lipolytica TaxID=1662421 RepID=A0ABV8UGL9_9PROT